METRNFGESPRPRYTRRQFPLYRFLPGKNPHPRRDPQGHSYGQPEPVPEKLSPERWHEARDYLYAVDLYNHGYWWECHEVFEALWHAAGHNTVEGQFYRALIQLAAANIKQAVGKVEPAQRLLRSGLQRLAQLPEQYMGIDVAILVESVQEVLGDSNPTPVLIRLNSPGICD